MLTVVGFDNFFDTALLTAPEASTDLEALNLQYDDLTLKWRTPSAQPNDGWLAAAVGGGEPVASLQWFALIDHNLLSLTAGLPNGKWRVRTVSIPHEFLVRPASLVSSVNLSGTIAAFAERNVQSPDLVSLTAISTSLDTQAVLRFTPSSASLHATTPQTIEASVSASAGAGVPLARMELLQGGVLLKTLVPDTAVIAGTYLGGTFVLSDLISQATPIDIRIIGTHGGTATVNIDAVTWRREIQASGAYDYYDSGLMSIALPTFYRSRALPVLNAIHKAPAAHNARQVWIDIQDLGTPAGYYQIGRALASTGIPIRMAADSWALGWDDSRSIKVDMRGGNERFHMRRKRRRANVQVPITKIDAALDTMFDQIERTVGVTGSLLWVFDDETPSRWSNTAIFGRIPELADFTNVYKHFRHEFSVLETL